MSTGLLILIPDNHTQCLWSILNLLVYKQRDLKQVINLKYLFQPNSYSKQHGRPWVQNQWKQKYLAHATWLIHPVQQLYNCSAFSYCIQMKRMLKSISKVKVVQLVVNYSGNTASYTENNSTVFFLKFHLKAHANKICSYQCNFILKLVPVNCTITSCLSGDFDLLL